MVNFELFGLLGVELFFFVICNILLNSFKSIIFFILKCGLHYLAMFKLFQRIVLARLTKEFLNV